MEYQLIPFGTDITHKAMRKFDYGTKVVMMREAVLVRPKTPPCYTLAPTQNSNIKAISLSQEDTLH
jgi:hypothetical protein